MVVVMTGCFMMFYVLCSCPRLAYKSLNGAGAVHRSSDRQVLREQDRLAQAEQAALANWGDLQLVRRSML